jgi:regulator of replication initiation timing
MGGGAAAAGEGAAGAVEMKAAAAAHTAAAEKTGVASEGLQVAATALKGSAEVLTAAGEKIGLMATEGATALKEAAVAETAAAKAEEEAAVAETTAAKAETTAAAAEETAAAAEGEAALAEGGAAAAGGIGAAARGLGGAAAAEGAAVGVGAAEAVGGAAIAGGEAGAIGGPPGMVVAAGIAAILTGIHELKDDQAKPQAPGQANPIPWGDMWKAYLNSGAAPPAEKPAAPVAPDRAKPFEQQPAKDRLVGIEPEEPLPPAFVPPAQRQPAAAVPVPPAQRQPETPAPDQASSQTIDKAATKIDEAANTFAAPKTDDKVSEKISALTDAIATSREHEVTSSAEVGGDKMNVAADKLEIAATKLEEAATKMGGAGAGVGQFGVPEPGKRTEKGATDAIDQIKSSIDKLVSGKGLIQPPKDPQARQSYDQDVRKVLESIAQVNDAQKGLIEEQTRATAEGEQLAKKQEELTSANTEKVKQEAQDEGMLTQAQVSKLEQETQDGHEIAQAQVGLIEAETEQVQAETNKTTSGDGHAAGGMVHGPGGPTSDSVPIMASAGEFVVNAKSTSQNRGLLETINSGEPIHFQFGGIVPGEPPNLMSMITAHGGTQPSTGYVQSALTDNIGFGPGGYMMAQMMNASQNQSYSVDLRTDHGTYAVLATEDQMGVMLQGSISSKIASTGVKPSWWS